MRSGVWVLSAAMVLVAVGCAKREVKLELTRETQVVEPGIGQVSISPSGRVDTREGAATITVALTGDPGLQGSFDVGGLVRDQPLEEVSPGNYRGQFRLPQGATGQYPITARLVHPPSGATATTVSRAPLSAYRSEVVAELPCPREEQQAFDRALRGLELTFPRNVAVLSEQHKAALAAQRSVLESHPDCSIFVLGHASQPGADQYNMMLSIRRALNTLQHLKQMGIPEGRLERNFLGESQPKGGSSADPAPNRRVELRGYYPY